MDLRAASALARQLLAQHGLADWHFAFDNSKLRFGVCKWNKRTIGLSRQLVRLNDEAQVRDTLLHELAHALAPRQAGHGPIWRAMAAAIGAKPERCYSSDTVAQPALPYQLRCLHCNRAVPRARRLRRGRRISCGTCSPRSFNPERLLVFEVNPNYRSA
ncbi:MAG: SprT-like domain-containing protein [Elusimicrobiota bacterium]